MKMVTLELECRLTEQEQLVKMRRLVALLREQALADETKKSYMAKLNADKKERIVEATAISDAIHAGKELREVECVEELEGNHVCVYRIDTHDMVDRRPATAEERQAPLRMS